MCMSIIDCLYNSMANSLDYKDLPDTEKAGKQLKSCVMGHFGGNDVEAYKQWMALEKQVEAVGSAKEHQGFVYGFQHAMELFIGNGNIHGRGGLEENIRCEYSTPVVEGIDRTDKVVGILEEYLPKDKLPDAIDILCACVNETKYAAFEQGFLRGIAVAKGNAL